MISLVSSCFLPWANILHPSLYPFLLFQIPNGMSLTNAQATTLTAGATTSATRYCGRYFNFASASTAGATVCSKSTQKIVKASTSVHWRWIYGMVFFYFWKKHFCVAQNKIIGEKKHSINLCVDPILEPILEPLLDAHEFYAMYYASMSEGGAGQWRRTAMY